MREKHLHHNVLGESSQEYFKFLKQRADELKPSSSSSLSACTRPSSEAGRTCQIKKAEKAAWCNRTDTLFSMPFIISISEEKNILYCLSLLNMRPVLMQEHTSWLEKTLEVRTYSALIHSFVLMRFVLVCACGCLCSFSGRRALSAHSFPSNCPSTTCEWFLFHHQHVFMRASQSDAAKKKKKKINSFLPVWTAKLEIKWPSMRISITTTRIYASAIKYYSQWVVTNYDFQKNRTDFQQITDYYTLWS